MTDGAFNMPWGTKVRVVRAPEGVMVVGAVGTLCDPMATYPHEVPGVVALLHVPPIHWSIHADGWEFEPIEQPALRREWVEFAARCRDQVLLIVQNRDDGFYAKRYAQDVDRLLRMLDHIDAERTHPSGAFEATK